MTRFPVSALRSVDLGTPDIDRSEQFYVAVWGLEVIARHNGVVYMRAGGSYHHVVALHQSARPELRAVTLVSPHGTTSRRSRTMSRHRAGMSSPPRRRTQRPTAAPS